MIDLHMHTTYSDGTDNVIEILKKAQDKNLDYISITDHNTAKAYEELEQINVENYYKGKIIKGIELNTKMLNIPIEILGYKIDYKIMNDLVQQIYLSQDKRNKIEVSRVVEKCKIAGIKLDEEYINSYDNKTYASKFIHKAITQNEENKKFISEDTWNDSKGFYRKYMSNPKTLFFVEMDDLVPDFETAVNLVRKARGMVFIPHIFEYGKNALPILESILNNYKIDGIECYYTTFSKEQNEYLLNLCKNKNLYISGGSDYHGLHKPGIDLGVGYGNLAVPNAILSWLNI